MLKDEKNCMRLFMITKNLFLMIIFVTRAFVINSVNAGSMQGISQGSSTTTTTTSSTAILFNNTTQSANQLINAGGTQSVGPIQDSDIAELKRRADDSDQKLVRVIAYTKELKETCDQLKVNISNISSHQSGTAAPNIPSTTTVASMSMPANANKSSTASTSASLDVASILGLNTTVSTNTANQNVPSTQANNVIIAQPASIQQGAVPAPSAPAVYGQAYAANPQPGYPPNYPVAPQGYAYQPAGYYQPQPGYQNSAKSIGVAAFPGAMPGAEYPQENYPAQAYNQPYPPSAQMAAQSQNFPGNAGY